MQNTDSSKAHTPSNNRAESQNYLQNQLLIAMPGLNDPYFNQSVTLICQHTEEGCFGITINKTIPITVNEVLNQLKITDGSGANSQNTPSNLINTRMPALRGGPVQAEQGFIIHENSYQSWNHTIAISDDISVTLSQDILHDIAAGNGPDNYLLALGCASWEAGQIEAEILENAWLNCPVDTDLIFSMPFDDRWQGAADLLGIDLNSMTAFAGHD